MCFLIYLFSLIIIIIYLLFIYQLQLLSTQSLNSRSHMNVASQLTVSAHLSGLAVNARVSAETGFTVTADDTRPVHRSSTVAASSTAAMQPSIHSLAGSVEMYFDSEPSGACCASYFQLS